MSFADSESVTTTELDTIAENRSRLGFVQKVFEIVSRQDLDNCIRWNARGDEFVVPDVERLETEVLPQYFKSSNIASFVRQLNFYGFRKLTKTRDVNATWIFSHPKFTRDANEDQLNSIKRKTAQSADPTKTELAMYRQEVGKLRDKVKDLQSKLDEKTKELEKANTKLEAREKEIESFRAQLSQQSWTHAPLSNDSHNSLIVNHGPGGAYNFFQLVPVQQAPNSFTSQHSSGGMFQLPPNMSSSSMTMGGLGGTQIASHDNQMSNNQSLYTGLPSAATTTGIQESPSQVDMHSAGQPNTHLQENNSYNFSDASRFGSPNSSTMNQKQAAELAKRLRSTDSTSSGIIGQNIRQLRPPAKQGDFGRTRSTGIYATTPSNTVAQLQQEIAQVAPGNVLPRRQRLQHTSPLLAPSNNIPTSVNASINVSPQGPNWHSQSQQIDTLNTRAISANSGFSDLPLDTTDLQASFGKVTMHAEGTSRYWDSVGNSATSPDEWNDHTRFSRSISDDTHI